MHYILLFSLLLSCSGPIVIKGDQTVPTVDHSSWNELLQKHVDTEGNVDYQGFVTDKEALANYLERLAKNPIANNADKNERLAYYINLYNAGTVQLILDNYPLKSIKDIFRPWGKDIIPIGNDSYSLGDIEHKILRKMDEPRIHFAINCASYSCPKLLNKAYTADKMDAQLEQAAIDFINDPKRNTIEADTVVLSEIFNWFKRDFTKNGSLLEYIDHYANTTIDKNAKLSYRNYDWSLNEAK
ncbi:DUF547 domain-containing protein [Flavobacteriaceae bacterium TP-CH-4]|uniref:DUF547 domain-containing protein n=1 Tax=Pelagihabitans pacificus TaxID=2696054 RepID=A0A967AUY3_9FLAO|nr:DUF547 domain-containing protein [Pelagihabitans pacificus]NHF60713.1 DUF547 domain-containing protein [Pelagihabitans pacificus]